jgi:hypothetical protein
MYPDSEKVSINAMEVREMYETLNHFNNEMNNSMTALQNKWV